MLNGDTAAILKLFESGGMAAFAAVLLWSVIVKLPRDVERIADKLALRMDRLTEAIGQHAVRQDLERERSVGKILEEVKRLRVDARK